MYTDVWHQLFLFFVFFAIGAVFALLYDTLRVSGRFVPKTAVFTIFGDILFWIIVTVVMFVVCLKFNDGEIRFFMLAGVLLGALLYFNTLSRFVVFILSFIADWFKKIILFLLKTLFMPVRLLLRLLNKPVFIAFSVTRKNAVKILKKIKFKFKIFKKFKR